jgi:hypothetical protein
MGNDRSQLGNFHTAAAQTHNFTESKQRAWLRSQQLERAKQRFEEERQRILRSNSPKPTRRNNDSDDESME